MFFKYNKLTQGLAAATQDVAMGRPVTPGAFKMTVQESPEIHYEYKPVKVAEVHHGSPAESGVYLVPNTTRFKKLMSLQVKFVTDDGRLVWQKFGSDKSLYFTAAVMVAVGFVWSLYGIRKLTSPPKNE